VLEGSHGPTDSDNFTLELLDLTAGDTVYSVSYSSANTPGYFNYYNGWYWSPWQVNSIDVSGRLGHDFTLTMLGSDCPYGGHAGYVYLDGFGAAPPPQTTPEPGTLAMLGSGVLFAANWIRRRF
jgi:hypothetical protein